MVTKSSVKSAFTCDFIYVLLSVLFSKKYPFVSVVKVDFCTTVNGRTQQMFYNIFYRLAISISKASFSSKSPVLMFFSIKAAADNPTKLVYRIKP